MINTYYVILGVICPLFLAQNLRTKVLTAQKSLLLECLIGFTWVYLGSIWIIFVDLGDFGHIDTNMNLIKRSLSPNLFVLAVKMYFYPTKTLV